MSPNGGKRQRVWSVDEWPFSDHCALGYMACISIKSASILTGNLTASASTFFNHCVSGYSNTDFSECSCTNLCATSLQRSAAFTCSVRVLPSSIFSWASMRMVEASSSAPSVAEGAASAGAAAAAAAGSEAATAAAGASACAAAASPSAPSGPSSPEAAAAFSARFRPSLAAARCRCCCCLCRSATCLAISPLASLTRPSARCQIGPRAAVSFCATSLPFSWMECCGEPSCSSPGFRSSPTCSLTTTEVFRGLTFSQKRPTKSKGPSSSLGSTVLRAPMLSFCISFIIMEMVSLRYPCSSRSAVCSA
mmetsp:Transcript_104838/g.291987  ORF Transcript_104838/g.291987 Transcript_104838/m.291987 type:complete len:307 (+) Transcript_104838:30-950(+)